MSTLPVTAAEGAAMVACVSLAVATTVVAMTTAHRHGIAALARLG